jgi:DNA-binding IclR family transcriptional regulator
MILEILSDGKWHEIKELQQQAEIDEHQVEEVTKFLNEFDFVKVDSANKKVRISKSYQKLLAQTST